jgi:hypothetical protein
MKLVFKFAIILIIAAFFLAGCSEKEITAPRYGSSIKASAGNPDEFTIWAGQNINAGTMSVWNDSVNIYVKFNLIDGWLLEQTHVQLDTDLVGDWIHDNGTPVPGQFDYIMSFNPMVATYIQVIPLADYMYEIGDTIVIAAHASVKKYDPSSGGYQQETAWGGDNPGPGPRWWFYMYYVITPPEVNPPDYDYQYETAMIRMYDVPTDYTYRWIVKPNKPHAWFSYVKTTPTLQPQTYYFYAGQYYKAGEVQIWKAGDSLFVQCNMMNGWEATGSHLNVQLTGYTGSPSFGLFPYTAAFDPAVGTFTYNVPWNSEWDGMELNISLHADVRKEIIPE